MQLGPDDLIVPKGRTLLMEPTGLHIMCLDLTEPLVEGEEVEVTLTFETAGDRVVDIVVGGR